MAMTIEPGSWLIAIEHSARDFQPAMRINIATISTNTSTSSINKRLGSLGIQTDMLQVDGSTVTHPDPSRFWMDRDCQCKSANSSRNMVRIDGFKRFIAKPILPVS